MSTQVDAQGSLLDVPAQLQVLAVPLGTLTVMMSALQRLGPLQPITPGLPPVRHVLTTPYSDHAHTAAPLPLPHSLAPHPHLPNSGASALWLRLSLSAPSRPSSMPRPRRVVMLCTAGTSLPALENVPPRPRLPGSLPVWVVCGACPCSTTSKLLCGVVPLTPSISPALASGPGAARATSLLSTPATPALASTHLL
jgi:hypothetical protein